MSLQARLDAIKKSFREQAGPEMTALFDRTTQEVIDSGQAERALGVGAEFPDFALPDTNGETVRFSEARGGAASVVTFYRGKW
jgi:hypothetical protein